MPHSSNRAIILVGILIVILIAFGLFHYSERVNAPSTLDQFGEILKAPAETASTTIESVSTTTQDSGATTSAAPNPLPAKTTKSVPTAPKAATVPTFGAIITLTDKGFEPSRVTIFKGQTVRFINKSSERDMWVASGIHPTHASYQERSTHDCLGSTFDECEAVKQGKYWDFAFNLVGSWEFHNHMRATDDGTVYVKERE